MAIRGPPRNRSTFRMLPEAPLAKVPRSIAFELRSRANPRLISRKPSDWTPGNQGSSTSASRDPLLFLGKPIPRTALRGPLERLPLCELAHATASNGAYLTTSGASSSSGSGPRPSLPGFPRETPRRSRVQSRRTLGKSRLFPGAHRPPSSSHSVPYVPTHRANSTLNVLSTALTSIVGTRDTGYGSGGGSSLCM